MAILLVSSGYCSVCFNSPRVHVNTKVEVLVQVVGLLARVGESDIAEGDNGRRELLDILEVESEEFGNLHSLNKTSSLHLVNDLLLGLGLLDQVGVSTSGSNEL